MIQDKIFPTAGHNAGGNASKEDPGAMANGYKENELNILFRDKVAFYLKQLGADFECDNDTDRLTTVIFKLKKKITSKDVLLDIHLNAASPSATGVEGYYSKYASMNSIAMITEIVNSLSQIFMLRNRGVKPENKSQHNSIAILNLKGMAGLVELGFITNLKDVEAILKNMDAAALAVAKILKKFDDLIQ